MAAVILTVISFLAWRARKSAPYLLIGWLWFLGTLVPVIGLVQVGGQALADRYTYVPLIGVFIAIAYGAADLVARFRISNAIPSVAAGVVLVAMPVRDGISTAFLAEQPNALCPRHCGDEGQRHCSYQSGCRAGTGRSPAGSDCGISQGDRNRTTPIPGAQQSRESASGDRPARRGVSGIPGSVALKSRHRRGAHQFRHAPRRNGPLRRRDERIYESRATRPGRSAFVLFDGQSMPAPRAKCGGSETFSRGAATSTPNDFETLTWLARVLAADQNPAARNGAEAISLAEQATHLAGGEQPFVLDTLAMAYAEAGRFKDAQTAVQKAIQAAATLGAQKTVPEMQERLHLYQNGQPYREDFSKELGHPK